MATKPKPIPPRAFPFKAGTGYKRTDAVKAAHALDVFEVLWEGYKAGRLSANSLGDVFFAYVSQRISDRESWKCGRYWTPAAWQAFLASGSTNSLKDEHVLPRPLVLAEALQCADVAAAKKLVLDLSFTCVVTEGDDQLLTDAGLKSKGYPHDPWLRYKQAGLQVKDVHYPAGVPFLSPADRAPLIRHEILLP